MHIFEIWSILGWFQVIWAKNCVSPHLAVHRQRWSQQLLTGNIFKLWLYCKMQENHDKILDLTGLVIFENFFVINIEISHLKNHVHRIRGAKISEKRLLAYSGILRLICLLWSTLIVPKNMCLCKYNVYDYVRKVWMNKPEHCCQQWHIAENGTTKPLIYNIMHKLMAAREYMYFLLLLL